MTSLCKTPSGQHEWREGREFFYCTNCGVLGRDDRWTPRRGKSKSTGNGNKVQKLIERDGPACHYCGVTEYRYTVDHVIPRSKGGANTLDNLVLACPQCNHQKADKLPHEFVAPRRQTPTKGSRRRCHTREHLRADGLPKRAYGSMDEAVAAAQFLADRDGHWMEAFECIECADFHVRIVPGMWALMAKQARRLHDDALVAELGERTFSHLKIESAGSSRARRFQIAKRWRAVEKRLSRASSSSEVTE